MATQPNSQWNQQTIQDAFKKVMERAATDQNFRNLALSHPNEAVEQVSGRPVPPGVNLRFIDNAGAHYTIVLPDSKRGDASELSDAQLEQVAGGRGSACSPPCQPMALSVTG